MDVPPAICQTADLARLAPAARDAPRAAAQGRLGEMLYIRAGDDLLAFPAAYALTVPDLARFGCVARTREVAFAFRLSDLAPAGEGAPALPSGAGAVAPTAAPSAAAAPKPPAAPANAAGPNVVGPDAAAAGGSPAAPAASGASDIPAPPSGVAAAATSASGAEPAGSRPTLPGRGADDLIVRVVALHMGRHADFKGMTRAIASVRKEEARRGFVHALERFPTPAGDRLVRISEDRCLILSLPPDPAAPGAQVDMRFQNEEWSAVVEVPAAAAGRWEAVYGGIERFLAAHLVRNFFRK